MAQERTPIEISQVPQLAQLVADLRRGARQVVLQEHGEDVAVLRVLETDSIRRMQGIPVTAEDPLWNIVGIGCSGGPGDVSRNKYKYLAEAYAPRQE